MKKTCVIISGGEYSPICDVPEGSFVIACDKGVEYALKSGIKPDFIIGDFDSYSGRLPEDIEIVRLPVEKDDTDTMAAMRYAVENGYNDICIYCALGGRLDHLYANLQTCAFGVKNNAFCKIVSSECVIYFISDSALRLEKKENASLSVFSVTDTCKNVTVSGTKYKANGIDLENTFPIGASNCFESDFAEISVGEGILAVMVCNS